MDNVLLEKVNSCCVVASEAQYGLWNKFKKLDRALVAFVVVLLATFAYSPTQAWDSTVSVVSGIISLSPYLIAAFTISAYLKAASVEFLITRIFAGKPVLIVVSASLFAVFSPLCACTVVPVIAVLLRAGIPLAAVMSFWIASPLMGPELYLYTGGIMGFSFANARFTAALTLGLVAGFATLLMQRFESFNRPLRDMSLYDESIDLGKPIDPVWKFWKENERVKIFKDELVVTTFQILKWVILALFIESLMGAYVPSQMFVSWMGESSLMAIPVATVLGVVFYINDIAGIPLLKGLVATGVSPGAALAMSVAGSVTSIPAMMAVYPLVKRKVFVWYMALALVFGVLSGYLYQAFLRI